MRMGWSRRGTVLQSDDTTMTPRSVIARLVQQEDINFLLTNRIPRGLLTRFVGWVSRIENPLFCRLCIGLWRLFTDLDLSESKKQRFNSVHECFTRELKEGARRIDTHSRTTIRAAAQELISEGRICGEQWRVAHGSAQEMQTKLVCDNRFRDGNFRFGDIYCERSGSKPHGRREDSGEMRYDVQSR